MAQGDSSSFDESVLGNIWMPQPGPQALAVTCPGDQIFFGGARGGGKTDCAIGRQIMGAMRHGYGWNGLFVRKNYKHFHELRRRLDELRNMGLPARRTGGPSQTNYLYFDNGAQIMLTAMETPEKLDFFQGSQFCVGRGTRILMGDGSPKCIEDIEVDDYVQTLEGPRRVNRKFGPRIDECVKATTAYGSQINPTSHPILGRSIDNSSAFCWPSFASLQGIDSKDIGRNILRFLRRPSANVTVRLSRHILDQDHSDRTETSRICDTCRESGLGSRGNAESLLGSLSSIGSCHSQHDRPERSLPDRSAVCSCATACRDGAYDLSEEQYPGCSGHYRPSDDYSDALFHLAQALGPNTLQRLTGVDIGNTLQDIQRKDARDNIQVHNHVRSSWYLHPYDGTVRSAVSENFYGACSLSPYGLEEVYDITVDEVNHYISYDTGLVNCNTEISVEEAPTFPFIDQLIDQLNGCLRSPHGIKCTMFLTGNPGGPGHNYIKSKFISPAPEGGVPIKEHEGADTKIFIPSNVEDNRILVENDPAYKQKLESIEDPELRRAWLQGDWDVILGGFFDDIWNQQKSRIVIPYFRPPKHWDRLMGFDWGSARPFSVGWYAISGGEYIPELGRALPRGALVRFFEWYGCVKDRPNTGIRMESRDVARQILELEQRHNLIGTNAVDRIADPAVFKQEDGPSIGEKMAEQGVVFRRGDNKRIPGWDVMRALMRGEMTDWEVIRTDDGEDQIINAIYTPMLYITENCKAWIRTVPVLERDEKEPEDIDTTSEDHIADETRYVCASRPGHGTSALDIPVPKTPMEREHEEIAAVESQQDDMEAPVAFYDLPDDPMRDAISADDEAWGI